MITALRPGERFEAAKHFRVVEVPNLGSFELVLGRYLDAAGNTTRLLTTTFSTVRTIAEVREPLTPQSMGVAMGGVAPSRQFKDD